jgi:hypothetical protein
MQGENMSFSELRDILGARENVNQCVRAIFALKSPQNVADYLVNIQRKAFYFAYDYGPREDKTIDKYKKEKWAQYNFPQKGMQLGPLTSEILLDTEELSSISEKLSFNISRFTEFLSCYNKIEADIKPIMLHYAMIYLFDFFSRTWLRYRANNGHGITYSETQGTSVNDMEIRLGTTGIFPRAVDAFYFLNEQSVFSLDNAKGNGLGNDFTLQNPAFKPMAKTKYYEKPTIKFGQLLENYERMKILRENMQCGKGNPILTGYAILFLVSSVCRYKPREWFKILTDRDLSTKLELLQHDFIYSWIPELLDYTVLRPAPK